MSFYDSASLAFLPSGGAGKDGKAYSIKPVPEYGNELITNGDFSGGSTGWTASSGWSIASGKATASATNNTLQTSTSIVTGGTNYLVSFEISNYSSGTLNVDLGTSTYKGQYTSNGLKSIVLTAGGFNKLRFYGGSISCDIDNVSIREVVVGDGDFTFSRGSNLAATRVDSNGLIEKGRENLFKYSNQFDNAIWQGTAVWTSGQVDKDGGTSAWTFAKINESASDFYNDTTTNGVQTFSIYAKKQIGVGLKPYFFGSSNGYATFNLEDGSVYNTSGSIIIDTNVETYNSLWWRISVTINGSSGNWYLYVTDGTDTQTTDVITLQDAQLESSLVATEYIESGASTGKAGLLENEPRFDYSNGASCPSLLLEPQRTNNIPQSEYLGDSIVWAQLETIVTQNEEVSPEGLQNASKLLCVSGFANHQIDAMNVSISSGAVTGSVYAKKGANADWLRLRLSGTSNPPRAWFDLQNGVVGSVDVSGTASIEDVGNGWYRCSLTEAGNTASGGGGRLQIFINKSDGQTQFTSNGDEYHYVYGAQMEAGSYATSYIPNHSGSGSVTRGADLCNGAGDASTFNDSEGVLYAEIAALTDDQSSRTITLTDGTFDERIQLSYYTGGSNQIRVFIKSGGTFSAVITTTLTDITEFNKIAYRYKSGETKLFINGSLIGTSADTFSITGLNVLQFANGDGLSNPLQGKAKQVIVFNTALSNTDLEILTGTSYESFAAMATALNYTTYE